MVFMYYFPLRCLVCLVQRKKSTHCLSENQLAILQFLKHECLARYFCINNKKNSSSVGDIILREKNACIDKL